MSGVALAGVAVLTGWGAGVESLPEDARVAAAGRDVVALASRLEPGERHRRATRECRLAIEVAGTLLASAGAQGPARDDTGVVYVTAGAYGPSNRAFIEDGGGLRALHFPYTAPSAVPGEVTIAFGLRGPLVTLVGGAPATVEALWHARRLVCAGACAAVVVLAVEVQAPCADLWRRGRWLVGRPLAEAAACALVVRGAGQLRLEDGAAPGPWVEIARRRAGETLACEPLVALGLALAAGADPIRLGGRWRGRQVGLEWRRPAGGARGDA